MEEITTGEGDGITGDGIKVGPLVGSSMGLNVTVGESVGGKLMDREDGFSDRCTVGIVETKVGTLDSVTVGGTDPLINGQEVEKENKIVGENDGR